MLLLVAGLRLRAGAILPDAAPAVVARVVRLVPSAETAL
jgi:hypothetical protein